jgi:N-acetylmuramoyl-L-alanine amidase
MSASVPARTDNLHRSRRGRGVARPVIFAVLGILGTATACFSVAPPAPPSPPPPPPPAVAGKTIVIDPGHNGQNWAHPNEINTPVWIGNQWRACDTTGTATDGGYTESAYNVDVAQRLADLLRQRGANVVLTRTDDNGWGPCIDERAAIGNRAHADVGISIHADGGPATGYGFHVIYPPSIAGLTDDIAVDSKRLALDVRGSYAAGTGMSYATYVGSGDGLSVRSDLGGLNLSDVPKVFIETGNMRNSDDAQRLTDGVFRQQAAVALTDGLTRYLAGQ